MRRADRLFQIVHHLRARRLTTGAQLAEWLNVSLRTVYRDIQDLSLSGVPVRGEAGMGYRIDRSYDLHPVMFTPDEVEAVVFGLRMAASFAGPDLLPHTQSALARITLALPEARRGEMEASRLFAPRVERDSLTSERIGPLRQAASAKKLVECKYIDESGGRTHRVIRPLGLFFWGRVWTLAGWCELRNDFRSFRLDRMEDLIVLKAQFIDEPEKSLDTFLERVGGRKPLS
jgi:predicted DNA-binding transcriptional regulator YafY